MKEILNDTCPLLHRDISSLINDPPLGISVAVEDDDCTLLHAIVTGVEGTPYAGGFFHFVLKCTNQYPMTPPKVRFLTTGYGKVRFNPNMYEGGKVCLSILGTWSGQQWLPSCSLESVLISIQSIMTKNALLNEPGFDRNSEVGQKSLIP
ncbi:ubiquitin-conjugating enzyme E2 Z-like [Frankliniella occidentalis]|uniref:Ubiquitin-conjugating enzyme E2 Z n=1 Tax=Frankliniella occidentalis TaxID=133901 RepID=A0A9C6X612_FRAOC|nr:ubiquitin-conjugating enzyme E2 Z-like [Frankliniella occidentalis]